LRPALPGRKIDALSRISSEVGVLTLNPAMKTLMRARPEAR